MFQKLSDAEVDHLFEGTTFGMEYDCGEFDRHVVVPARLGEWCTDEVASHSKAGVGADPKLQFNMFGGEFKLAPCDSENELLRNVIVLLERALPDPTLYFASTNHVHVRIPKLLEDPDLLKWLIREISIQWPAVSDMVYQMEWQPGQDFFLDWSMRCNHNVKTLVYSEAALARMQGAKTPVEIALALHNWPSKWKDEEWLEDDTAQVRRPAINFSHLRDLGTIEFRCFQATTDPTILNNIICYPLRFIRTLLTGGDLVAATRGRVFQDIFTFNPDNCHQHNMREGTTGYFNSREDIETRIRAGLIGKTLSLADLNYPQYWIDKGFQ